MSNATIRLGIIGTGALGSVLARRLADRGYSIGALINRTIEKAAQIATQVDAAVVSSNVADLPGDLDAVFLCVPDDSLEALAIRLSRLSRNWSGCIVIHTSGALGSDVLAPIATEGAQILSFHPIQTFSLDSTPDAIEGIFVDIEGDEQAVEFGERLAVGLGANPIVITKEAKGRLHLAASILSNYSVILASMAGEVMGTLGYDWGRTGAIFQPLVAKTWQNLLLGNPGSVLSGPVVRGDLHTIALHLDTLSEHLPHLLELYAALAEEAGRLGVESGRLSRESALALEKTLAGHRKGMST